VIKGFYCLIVFVCHKTKYKNARPYRSYVSSLKMPTKNMVYFSEFFCFLLTEGSFTPVFKDNKLFKNNKTAEIKGFPVFLLVDGSGYGKPQNPRILRIRIRSKVDLSLSNNLFDSLWILRTARELLCWCNNTAENSRTFNIVFRFRINEVNFIL
jgi:hypothetical protein